MGLAETQKALARLYTDADLRARFFADPAGVGAEFGLAPAERAQFEHLAAADVQFFAATLIAKRRHEVMKLLPLSARALGERFAPLFQQYAEGAAPGGSHKHLADALAFAAFVLERGAGAAARESLRYEEGWLLASRPGRKLIARWLREGPREAPSLALWWRLSPHAPLRHRHWTLPRLAARVQASSVSRYLMRTTSLWRSL